MKSKRLKLENADPKFRPTQDRVQFTRILPPPPKPGEIVIPREPGRECRVLTTGPKVQHVKAGDTVLIDFNVGQQIAGIEGRTCRESEILAIITK